jgi:hypothetical protein
VPEDGDLYVDIDTEPFTVYIGYEDEWHITSPTADDPSATASEVAVNGTATTYMRSDAAPAVQKASDSQYGIVQVDGTTITAADGVISSAPGLPEPADQGDILFRGASDWELLTAGTAGQVLTTQGAAADPTWETPSGGSSYSGTRRTGVGPALSAGTTTTLTWSSESYNEGVWTYSAGVFTVPTNVTKIDANLNLRGASVADQLVGSIEIAVDGSTYVVHAVADTDTAGTDAVSVSALGVTVTPGVSKVRFTAFSTNAQTLDSISNCMVRAATGSGGVAEGTSFPGSPITGERYYRTDRHIEYFYDGTRWLSTQLLVMQLSPSDHLLPFTTTEAAFQGRTVPPFATLYGIYVEALTYTTIFTGGAGNWTVTITRSGSGGTAPLTTLSGITAGTTARVSLNLVYNASDVGYFYYTVTENSGSASLYFMGALTYRLIG